jgi:signal transduction histidine kinase
MATAQLLPAPPANTAPLADLDERSLSEAFAAFSKVAASLEHSYSRLQTEVSRLRRELEETHRDLASSLKENERLQQEHELLRRRQALAELAATLAHEIRNPLGSLELFAGLLAESKLGGAERDWVEHLRAGLRTLAATVNNVLHFHSQSQAELAPIDLGALLRSIAQFLEPVAQRAKVRLELALAPEDMTVAADRHRLEQVVLNLAFNSFQFMRAGGVLRITCHATCGTNERVTKEKIINEKMNCGKLIRVEIADTGRGIAPEDLTRIFDAGFSTRAGSPGLGLAVCKTIMEQHGGTIAAWSRPGRGARFTLEFPAWRKEE